MHPRTAELLQHLEQNRAILRRALDGAPLPLRERKPAPERWSAAEVLEHLAIVEQQVGALLRRGLRRALADGALPRDPDHTPVVPTIDAQLLLDRERRLQAREGVAPSRGLTAEQAWTELESSRAVLRDVLLAADGLVTSSIRAPHPFLGELTFHQWIAFVGFHEARHAAQIRATVAALRG
ncbi:MAG TPA: DinB family protein [Planctomycetota bacterium]